MPVEEAVQTFELHKSKLAAFGLLYVQTNGTPALCTQTVPTILYVLLQLVQLFTNKQRTGVLELEAGLEAYIIPPCPLVGRLLRTAKKSASMTSHDASLIPSALDSCQLLLAIIHKKVCTSMLILA